VPKSTDDSEHITTPEPVPDSFIVRTWFYCQRRVGVTLTWSSSSSSYFCLFCSCHTQLVT